MYETTTEILPAREYLVIPGFHPFRDIVPQEEKDWNKRFGFVDTAWLEELKKRSGGDAV